MNFYKQHKELEAEKEKLDSGKNCHEKKLPGDKILGKNVTEKILTGKISTEALLKFHNNCPRTRNRSL